jgi:hypothetical protein
MSSTHYFDTNLLNHLVDSPEGEGFVSAIQEEKSHQLFVSPINVEELKLAPQPRRIQLVKLLNRFRSQIVLVKHPDVLSWLEFDCALRGRRFNGNNIVETDDGTIRKFHSFLEDPGCAVDEEERRAVEHKKLLHRYIQITTRKEPKGRFSYSDVERSRVDAMTLSVDDLKKRLKQWGNIDFVNQPYQEKDVAQGLKFRLIEILAKFRPQIRYFFDKENGPVMLRLTWPNKQKDKIIARRIANIDFRELCPGSWMRDSVYFGQAAHPIEPGNWADGAHAFYLPYVGLFWTSDETLFRIMKSVRISASNYCGEICYLQHFLKKKS